MLRTSFLWLLTPFGSSMDIDWCRQNPCWWEAGRSSLASSSQAAILPPCLEKSRDVCHRAEAEWRDSEVLQSSCKMTYRCTKNCLFAYYLLYWIQNIKSSRGGLLEQVTVASAFLTFMGQCQAWFLSHPISPLSALLGKEKWWSWNATTWALPLHGQGVASYQPWMPYLLKAVKRNG